MIPNNIRKAESSDRATLLEIWYRSVKATHHFLTDQDINNLYHELKNEWLNTVELWLLEDHQQIIGFIGFYDNKVEMLFIDDKHQGQGYGKQLLNFAKQKYPQLLLDVNEQNPHALAFYQKQGFEITGRSPMDSQGNPFPLLHMCYIA